MIIFHSGGDRSPFPFDACTLRELLRWLLEGVDLWGAREGVTDCDASLRGRPLAGFSMGALLRQCRPYDLSCSTKLFLLLTLLIEGAGKKRNVRRWRETGARNSSVPHSLPYLYFSIFGILPDTGDAREERENQFESAPRDPSLHSARESFLFNRWSPRI
jgi:hypothetical protein